MKQLRFFWKLHYYKRLTLPRKLMCTHTMHVQFCYFHVGRSIGTCPAKMRHIICVWSPVCSQFRGSWQSQRKVAKTVQQCCLVQISVICRTC